MCDVALTVAFGACARGATLRRRSRLGQAPRRPRRSRHRSGALVDQEEEVAAATLRGQVETGLRSAFTELRRDQMALLGVQVREQRELVETCFVDSHGGALLALALCWPRRCYAGLALAEVTPSGRADHAWCYRGAV